MNLFNPYVVLGFVGVLLVSFSGGGLLGWHEKAIRVPAMLESQQTIDQQACAKVQQLTKDANDVLQKDRDGIAAKLAALRVQHPSTCVRVASSSNLPAGGGQHAGQDGNGLNSGWLRDYAAEAEQYRAEVMVCTEFLANERQIQSAKAQ